MQWTTTGDRITLPYVAPEDDLQSTPATIKALAEAVVAELELATPVGAISPYMGDVAPDGWLMCDGSQYDPSDLPELHAANGDFHGDGTFRVPDFRGRSPIGIGGGGVAREWALGERWGDQQPGRHTHSIMATSNHLDPRVVFVKGGGPVITGNWIGTDYAGSAVQTEDGSTMHAAPSTGWTDPDNWMGNAKNYQPSTGVNFIVYAGRPTAGITPVPGGEMPAVTTRMMIEARLVEADISEEEVKMLKEQLEELKRTEAA